jgi:hypothetical protein
MSATRPAQEANRVDASDLVARQDGPEVCCHCVGFYGLHPANCPCPKPPEPTRDDPPPEAFVRYMVDGLGMDPEVVPGVWRDRFGGIWRKARER